MWECQSVPRKALLAGTIDPQHDPQYQQSKANYLEGQCPTHQPPLGVSLLNQARRKIANRNKNPKPGRHPPPWSAEPNTPACFNSAKTKISPKEIEAQRWHSPPIRILLVKRPLGSQVPRQQLPQEQQRCEPEQHRQEFINCPGSQPNTIEWRLQSSSSH